MARVPEEVIQSVQDRVDIVDLISRFVTLKRSGSSFRGLCPFHEEKTPSFHVFPSSGRYKCFGCGEGGDALTFLMGRKGIGFRDALEELAREAGVALPEERETPGDRERRERRGRALDALAFAAEFFRVVLGRETGRAAREYLRGRGFSPETLEAFRVGYAPDEFDGLGRYARGKGFSDAVLFDAGLLRRNERGQAYDMFRGRIMFPICDLSGQVIGFGGRAMGDLEPKYLNSPDGPLFHKSREMYGLDLARPAGQRAGRLVVVEGYTDVMVCHQNGLAEVAAGLGTALTPENVRQLRRFKLPVQLVFDGDEAGRRAAERAADLLLEEQVEGSVALLPAGRDPADLLLERGREAMEETLAGAEDLWDYRVERVLARHDQSTLDGREGAVEELMGTVGRMADPLRRDVALRLLSERFGIRESTLRGRVAASQRPLPGPGPDPAPAALSAAWRSAERDLIGAALLDAGLWRRAQEEVYPPEEFRDADLREVALAIRDLHRGGESVTRVRLLGALADRDGAVRALQAIEADEAMLGRARRHVEGLARRRSLDSALASNDLEAVVRARRKDTPAR